MEKLVSRKERRKQLVSQQRFRQMKKGAALMGTTMTACSLATPLIRPVMAQAAEDQGVAQVSGDLSQVASRSNATAFITEIAAHAQPVANANDLYASVMIAQAIVESGWGTSTLSRAPYYNLFGIKGSYQGKTVHMNTLEYLNGKWVTMKEPFRDYPSFKESFADNAYTLRNVVIGGQYYYRGAWKSNTKSYRDATAWLTGRYATAPNYASTLNGVIQKYGLTRYDTPASGSAGGGASAGSAGNTTGSGNSSTTPSGNQTYTVKSGDSVWLIANKYGISMSQLISWNNIKNNFIYPGQKLIVKKGTTGNGGGSTNSNTNKPSVNKPSTGSTANKPANTSGNQTYTVKSGDSVWGISTKYGISMSQFCAWNNIKNNFIYPGQKVIVKKTATNNNSANTNTSKPSINKPSANKPNTNIGSAAANTGGNKTYTVKSGDSVWLIANKNGISMDQLIQWNKIKNNFVYPGQKLIVKKDAAANNSNQTSNSTNKGKTYTVKSGDSVWLIADKHGITMDQLIQWNNIKNNFIYPGQKVIVKK